MENCPDSTLGDSVRGGGGVQCVDGRAVGIHRRTTGTCRSRGCRRTVRPPRRQKAAVAVACSTHTVRSHRLPCTILITTDLVQSFCSICRIHST